MNLPYEEAGIHEIARRARGTPRIALRLLRRVRDYADVRADGKLRKMLPIRLWGGCSILTRLVWMRWIGAFDHHH